MKMGGVCRPFYFWEAPAGTRTGIDRVSIMTSKPPWCRSQTWTMAGPWSQRSCRLLQQPGIFFAPRPFITSD